MPVTISILKIILKKVGELSFQELEQLEALIYRYYPSASPKFVSDRLKKDYGYDIVMIKDGDSIQGVNFYHLIKYRSNRLSRPHFILHFGQAMKKSGYRGDVIWKLGTWYARKKLSRIFLLQKVTGMASFISPKAFEHYIKLFPRHHYEPKTEEDKDVLSFVTDYFNKVRSIPTHYNHGFCFDSTDLKKEDITEDWERIYRAKNEQFNQLFIDNGIIKTENERIYKMPRHITVCGIHRPILFDKKLNLPSADKLKRVCEIGS